MTDQNLLTAAQGLRELIESEADGIEQNATMSEPVVAGIAEAGLFRLMVPQALGGHEADPATIIDVSEAIAYADGSVGWAYCQNCSVMAYSAYLETEYGRQIAEARAAAGMFAPLGIAEKVDGGFRVSGSYLFGSGSGHAQYMGGACLVMENGEMVFDGELPEMVSFIVPAENIELKGNWNVMGLCGTGSFDFEVPEQFVDKGQTYPIFTREPATRCSMTAIISS